MTTVKKIRPYERDSLASRVLLPFVAAYFIAFTVYACLEFNTGRFRDPAIVERDYVRDVIGTYRTGLTQREEFKLASVIVEESRSYGLDPLLVLAVIQTESTFNNWARSNKGALGLMQLLPPTAKHVAGELSIGWDGAKMLFEPEVNVRMGIHYYSYLLKRFREDERVALAAYNRGPTALSRRLRHGKSIPQRYINKVITNYERLKKSRDGKEAEVV